VDLDTDRANCGGCGLAFACADGQVCNGLGACTLSCQLGLNNCSGTCVDRQTDEANCGACGTNCQEMQTCTTGACTCEPGFDDCDALTSNGCEANLVADDSNCGGCGLACAANETCNGGSCVCDPGFADCTAAAGCETNTIVDEANCGGCNVTCGSQEFCDASSCVCVYGWQDCDSNGTCEADLNSAAACGACGVSCSATNGLNFCIAQSCNPICNTGFDDCDANTANGCEANLDTDATNCGGCGITCPTGAVCSAGACYCDNATSGQLCAPSGVTWTSALCDTGGTVTDCLPTCDAFLDDCNDDLVDGCETDLRTTSNCTACGNVCPGPQTCQDLGGGVWGCSN